MFLQDKRLRDGEDLQGQRARMTYLLKPNTLAVLHFQSDER